MLMHRCVARVGFDYTTFIVAVLVHTPPAGSYQVRRKARRTVLAHGSRELDAQTRQLARLPSRLP